MMPPAERNAASIIGTLRKSPVPGVVRVGPREMPYLEAQLTHNARLILDPGHVNVIPFPLRALSHRVEIVRDGLVPRKGTEVLEHVPVVL
jgi:hypothetical protein